MSRFARRLAAFLLAVISGICLGHGLRPGAPASIAAAPSPVSNVVATALVAPPPPEPTWRVRRVAAARPGGTDVFVSTASDAALACGPGVPATLILRCMDGRTTAFVAHDCATPGGAGVGWPVAVTLDDGPTVETSFKPSADGTALGHWSYDEARPFIEAMADARTLALRFAVGDGRALTARFRLDGLAAPLADLRAACAWSDALPRPAGRDGAEGATAADRIPGAAVIPATARSGTLRGRPVWPASSGVLAHARAGADDP